MKNIYKVLVDYYNEKKELFPLILKLNKDAIKQLIIDGAKVMMLPKEQ